MRKPRTRDLCETLSLRHQRCSLYFSVTCICDESPSKELCWEELRQSLGDLWLPKSGPFLTLTYSVYPSHRGEWQPGCLLCSRKRCDRLCFCSPKGISSRQLLDLLRVSEGLLLLESFACVIGNGFQNAMILSLDRQCNMTKMWHIFYFFYYLKNFLSLICVGRKKKKEERKPKPLLWRLHLKVCWILFPGITFMKRYKGKCLLMWYNLTGPRKFICSSYPLALESSGVFREARPFCFTVHFPHCISSANLTVGC